MPTPRIVLPVGSSCLPADSFAVEILGGAASAHLLPLFGLPSSSRLVLLGHALPACLQASVVFSKLVLFDLVATSFTIWNTVASRAPGKFQVCKVAEPLWTLVSVEV